MKNSKYLLKDRVIFFEGDTLEETFLDASKKI